MRLTRDDITAALTDLAARLDAASITATIHVIGGSAISLEYNHLREATTDIDSWRTCTTLSSMRSKRSCARNDRALDRVRTSVAR